MNGISQILFFILLVTPLTLGAKNPDEGNPYEFGFTIDGEQHRHEKKDERGIIQGEFGFITADGIYHVTVYATDENGDFKILSMKNLRISAPLDGSSFKGEISPEANKYRKQANLAPLPPAQAAAPAPNPLSLPVAPPSQQVVITTPRPREPFKFTTQPTIKPACAGCGYVTTQKPIPGQSLFQFQKPFFQKQDEQNKPAQHFGSQDTQQPQTPNGVSPQNGAPQYKPTSGPQNTNYKPFGGAQGQGTQYPAGGGNQNQFEGQNPQNLGGHGQNTQYPGEAETENRFGGQNTQPGEGTQYPNGGANQIEVQNTQNLGGSGQTTQLPSGEGVNNQNQFGGQITQQGEGTLYTGGNSNQNQIGGQNTQNLGGSGESIIDENVNNVGGNQPNYEIEAPFVSSQVGGSEVGGGSSVEGASPSYLSGNGGQGGIGNYGGNSPTSGGNSLTGSIGTPQGTGFGQGHLPSYPQLGIPEPNPLKLPGQGPTGAVSSLPPVSISDGFIHVGGDKKQDIPIKDKFPGMQDGLPEGIDEKDITNLLYKFHYTVGFHGHYEKGLKNGAKIGGYFVNGRDGISRIVTYIADENGYRPKVRFVNLGLESDETPKAETEKTFGLKDFEFVWYPI